MKQTFLSKKRSRATMKDRRLKLLGVLLGLTVIMNLNFAVQAAEPKVGANSLSYAKVNNCSYLVILQLSNTGADKYTIMRKDLENGEEIEVMTLDKAQLIRSDYKYIDDQKIKKHGQYQYRVLANNQEVNSFMTTIANISPEFITNLSYYPKVDGTTLKFKLETMKDAEGDALEYRLYTRILGGGAEKIIKYWKISTETDKVQTVTFPDMTICEWKLTCVESDAKIKDRKEVTVINWTYLKFDLNHKLDQEF